MTPELTFHSLADAADQAFQDVLSIYNEAFPDDQRMSQGRLANLLATAPSPHRALVMSRSHPRPRLGV